MDEAVADAGGRLQLPMVKGASFLAQRGIQGSGEHSQPGNVRDRTYGARHERTTQPLRRHRDRRVRWRLPPDPAAFAAAADQAAWSRSASIVSAHLADKIISVVTVTAPDRYAAVAVARAVVSDALKRQALSSSPSAHDHARHRAQARSTPCS